MKNKKNWWKKLPFWIKGGVIGGFFNVMLILSDLFIPLFDYDFFNIAWTTFAFLLVGGVVGFYIESIKRWKKLGNWLKGGLVGLTLTSFIFILFLVISTLEDVLTTKSLICAFADTTKGCNLVQYVYTNFIYLFLYTIYFVIPIIIISIIIGHVFWKSKK